MIRPGANWQGRCLYALAGLLLACAGDDTPAATASPQELVAHGQRRLAEGDLPAATASFRRALLADTSSTQATLGLARVYQAQGRQNLAHSYQRRAFHQEYRHGAEARAAGDLPAARTAFAAAYLAMPNNPMAPLQLGEIWYEAGRADSAVAYLKQAVKANPRFAYAHVKLGQAYQLAGDLDAAQAALETAIEVNINTLEAYLALGAIFAERGEWAQSASHFERALLIRPGADIARDGLRRARAHL